MSVVFRHFGWACGSSWGCLLAASCGGSDICRLHLAITPLFSPILHVSAPSGTNIDHLVLWCPVGWFCSMGSDRKPKYNLLLFTHHWQLGAAEGNSLLSSLSPAPVPDFQGAISAWRIESNQGPRQRTHTPAACKTMFSFKQCLCTEPGRPKLEAHSVPIWS